MRVAGAGEGVPKMTGGCVFEIMERRMETFDRLDRPGMAPGPEARGRRVTMLMLSLLLSVIVQPASGRTDPAGAGHSGKGGAIGTEAVLPAAHPPADLIRLENPAAAAFIRHEIVAHLDPASGTLQASDRITLLHAPGTPAGQPVPFLLWKDLEIDGVSSDEFAVRLEPRDRMNPRSFWRRPPYDELAGYDNARQYDLLPGGAGMMHWPDTVRFTIRYSGRIADSLRAPAAAYARGFETTAGLIEARGVYLSGSSFWIPTRPDEVFTFLVEASVPDGWRTVSQGALAAPPGRESLLPGRHSDVWTCGHPMEEAYLVAGPWEFRERLHGEIAVQTFTYANTDSALCERYLSATSRYLDLYGELIGPYPFPKFAMVENFWQTGYGMPSFTLLGNRVIRLPFIVDTSYGHEILHNWWGNGVFVDHDGGNWCEGLTVYGADYLYKKLEGEEAAREYRLNALTSYADHVGGSQDMPLTQFRSRHDFASQAIGYSKAMMVVHELYRRAGGDAFREALRVFYRDNLWRRASWEDLLAAFSRTGGIDAPAFRRDWIDRGGAPGIRLGDVRLTQSGGGYLLQAGLEQEAGHPGSDPYDLIIPIRVTWDGADSTWMVPMATPGMEWSVRLRNRPASLRVDPDFEMMRRIDPLEVPPTLSRTLGSDTLTAVIAQGLDPGLSTAYRTLAMDWAGGQSLRVLEEPDLPPGWTPRTSVWFLGLGRLALEYAGRLVEVERRGEAWLIAGAEWPEDATVVLTGGLEGPLAWSLLDSRKPDQVAAAGRKVPHYGKYSYIIFEGDEAAGRGVWSETNSPLIHRFQAEQVIDRLKADVRFLTSEELEGRAPGGPGIEEAAAHIASQFRGAGLQPLDGEEGFILPFTPGRDDVRVPLDLEPVIPWGDLVLKNVVGLLPGTDPSAPIVLIGAHYDSRGPAAGGGYHPGADDNASGVAALLELARRLSGEGPFRSTLIFAAFSGEEQGMLGSHHFVATRREVVDRMQTMLNFDAVGRMEENRLYIIGSGTAAEFREMIDGVALGFDLDPVTPAAGPFSSDQLPFYEQGVPVLHFFTGPNPDYDRVTDTEDKINYQGLSVTVDFALEIAIFLADRGQPLTFVDPAAGHAPPGMPGHGSAERASLGTIPDFSRESGGVLLAGTMPGSPAESAGLGRGDLLVSLGGERVDNLGDLTELLRRHAAGDTVDVVIIRGGGRVELRVVLAVRR